MGLQAKVVSRRAFLIGLNLSVGGLALGLFPDGAEADEPAAKPGKPVAGSQAEEDRATGLNPSVFLHIAEDGAVTIVCARSEMGQGVRSSIPALIADELGARWDRVTVRQADGDKKYGDQNTDGSSSIRKAYPELRKVGATARQMLIVAAAKRWKVKPESCEARDHQVVHAASKRALGFGELVKEASKVPVPTTGVKLRPDAELARVNSPSLPVLDGRAIATGTAQFGADVRVDGMLTAVIARPPVVGGKVAKLDSAAALAVPGVKAVIEVPAATRPYKFQPWGGVAVVAENTWAALRGRAALKIEWDHGENAIYDSASFREGMLASVRRPGTVRRKVGDVEGAFAGATSSSPDAGAAMAGASVSSPPDGGVGGGEALRQGLAWASRSVEAEYTVPHLAHMPMEPPAALAKVANGKCEVWAPTQNPQAARAEAARILGLGEEAVTVHVTLLGGGFGRKSKADFVSEAAFLAGKVGAPVRVQWTREDDVQHGYYNAVNAQRFRAGLAADGRVVAWHLRTAFTPIATTMGGADLPSAEDLQQGVLDFALSVPNVQAEACAAKAHVRVGWYRSVYNIFHAFGVGSFIDEVAHARGADPREMWLEILGPARVASLAELGIEKLANYGEALDAHPVDVGRLRSVIERVTAASRWGARKAEGRALGLAAHRSFVAYTAVVVSVVRDERRKVRVDEAWIAMDAGKVVNQDRVRAQMEGAVVMGISNAMFGGITMKDGATEQSNFRDARIARIGDVPRQIHVDVVPSELAPCGVGEPGVPPVAPAIANAVFALTGQRVRDLPIARALGA